MRRLTRQEIHDQCGWSPDTIVSALVDRMIDVVELYPTCIINRVEKFRTDKTVAFRLKNTDATSIDQYWRLCIRRQDDVVALSGAPLSRHLTGTSSWFDIRFILCDMEFFEQFDRALVEIFTSISLKSGLNQVPLATLGTSGFWRTVS